MPGMALAKLPRPKKAKAKNSDGGILDIIVGALMPKSLSKPLEKLDKSVNESINIINKLYDILIKNYLYIEFHKSEKICRFTACQTLSAEAAF